jgi:hypothetical protein
LSKSFHAATLHAKIAESDEQFAVRCLLPRRRWFVGGELRHVLLAKTRPPRQDCAED